MISKEKTQRWVSMLRDADYMVPGGTRAGGAMMIAALMSKPLIRIEGGAVKTRADAREYVITAIEAGAASQEEYDIEAILDEIFHGDLAPGWDLDLVEVETFWTLVAKHAKGN